MGVTRGHAIPQVVITISLDYALVYLTVLANIILLLEKMPADVIHLVVITFLLEDVQVSITPLLETTSFFPEVQDIEILLVATTISLERAQEHVILPDVVTTSSDQPAVYKTPLEITMCS